MRVCRKKEQKIKQQNKRECLRSQRAGSRRMRDSLRKENDLTDEAFFWRNLSEPLNGFTVSSQNKP